MLRRVVSARSVALALVLALLVSLAGPLPLVVRAETAPQRYVDPSSSDSGDCSAGGSPCQTIGYALS